MAICSGACCTFTGIFLLALTAFLLVLAATLIVQNDDRTSSTRSKFGRGTKTPLYEKFIAFAIIFAALGFLFFILGLSRVYSHDSAIRAEERYYRERTQRLAEGAQEMQRVYLRRPPPPPEEHERLGR